MHRVRPQVAERNGTGHEPGNVRSAAPASTPRRCERNPVSRREAPCRSGLAGVSALDERREPPGLHFHSGLGNTSGAVARWGGHTTWNSPFCHWDTVPGVATFSLPSKRMGPTTVWNSWVAM